MHARAAAARTRWRASGAVRQVPVARQPGERVPSLLVSTRGALEARLTFERARVPKQRRRLRPHRCRAHESTCKRTIPRIPQARQSPSSRTDPHASRHTHTRAQTRAHAVDGRGARTGGGGEPDGVQLPRDRHRGLGADGAAGCAIVAEYSGTVGSRGYESTPQAGRVLSVEGGTRVLCRRDGYRRQ